MRAGSRAALDVLLTDAAIEPGTVGRLVQPADRRAAGRRRLRAARAAWRGASAASAPSSARIAAGSSEVAPRKGDRRFGDRAWQESWLFHRLMQAYLALDGAAEGLVDDAGLDWRTDLRARFLVDNLLDALAPDEPPAHQPRRCSRRRSTAAARTSSRAAAGSPATPPAAGCRRWSTRAGSRSAATSRVSEGSIVLRTDVFELIQLPAHDHGEVYETPLLIVPPTINKFYVVDLAPGRSLVEHLVGQGHQVFCISWRNPDAEHGHFDFDTYAQAVLRGARRGRGDRAPRRRQRAGGLLGRDHHRGRCSAISPTRASSATSSSLTLMVCRARQRAGGHDRGAGHPSRRGRGGRRVGAARLPRRARRWPASSRGCARTT